MDSYCLLFSGTKEEWYWYPSLRLVSNYRKCFVQLIVKEAMDIRLTLNLLELPVVRKGGSLGAASVPRVELPDAVKQSSSLQQLGCSEHTVGLVLSEGIYKIGGIKLGGINNRYAGKKAGNKTKHSRERHWTLCLSGDSSESVVMREQRESNAF